MKQFKIYRDYWNDAPVYSFDPYDTIFCDLDAQTSGEAREAAEAWRVIEAPDDAEVALDNTDTWRLYTQTGEPCTAGQIASWFLNGYVQPLNTRRLKIVK